MEDYFKIYDLEFNPIPLPKDDLNYGLSGIWLEVSSIGQEVSERSIFGWPGNIITGVRDSTRSLSLKAWLETMNTTDYQLKRDRVYDFFKNLGAFYVTESNQGNKLMKVRVVDQYVPERPVAGIPTFSVLNVPLKIDGQPYWISRFKTMDLHNNSGIPVNGHWSYGMGIDVTPANLIYQYENRSEFNIYNAGRRIKTVLEKDNCEIKIEIKQNATNFSLADSEGYWEYNPAKNPEWSLKNGDIITFNGHDVRLNGVTIMQRTNRYYLIIDRGINRFKINGLSNYQITFDFRFKYN